MARRRRRKSGESAALILASVILGVMSLGLLGGFVFLKVRASSNPKLDAATLCPVEGPNEITAVLLDVTDPISEPTALDLRNQFQELVSSVSVGGLIQVYALTEQEGELGRTFSGCNPGNGENVDEWTSNPRLAQDRWERGFQKPLNEISQRIAEGTEAKQSPIMAGIQKINLEAFGAPQYRQIPKRLIIASDMLEHTAAFSVYRDGADYATFERSGARDQFRTSLAGISVRILGFQRPGLKFDTVELAEFWTAWIGANGGQMERFTRLEGVR
ncbi:hypothetical protein PYH37_001529 [Sinorhizobium numidicum]|uniref:Uncharacterized protein n=1 Tax=Sinorhizobium numidicum TaxID=680248 RepID=A0ABY8CN87_9HYPH|nr:hypothetical protein [Sinorhizobium numidicum]WEX74144.1 hypothetical protein PYH37_001529 [Sinorhizobium numidicum]WEX80129.1 hypothetical protein PYH38_001530 [Sinorhizobium numidicum]